VEVEGGIGEGAPGAQEPIAHAWDRPGRRVEEEGGPIGGVGPTDAEGRSGDGSVCMEGAELEPVVGAVVPGDADGTWTGGSIGRVVGEQADDPATGGGRDFRIGKLVEELLAARVEVTRVAGGEAHRIG
jgi:hypothetical protein